MLIFRGVNFISQICNPQKLKGWPLAESANLNKPIKAIQKAAE